LSGGTGILRDMDLGISLALPHTHPWAKSVKNLYGEFVTNIAEALHLSAGGWAKYEGGDRRSTLCSPICFENRSADSLLIGNRKALGCAQVRKRDAVLIHGTLLYGLDVGLQSRIFGVARERIEAAMASVSLPGGILGFSARLVTKLAGRLRMTPRIRKREN